ncbi:dual specificity protein phosphatase family protein [Blastopirellula sp. JC732]|uniref:Dual specificity protein phosphatase family protein n=1 Tax=Blastopirellula sediminis TaxID=2894196 RepID=A0A9X1MMX0_9BACT|nr:dual specificity protein phosphatase [Blastopirellula sediminis]MCC9606594.1 dual specificity protein phosphatase family protein [Blastopirellula sediminis]MCC9630108.1 dual specificity protein phosphatase family protein [Blastopirellula sediminis]
MNLPDSLQTAMRTGIYWVSPRLAVGRFVDPLRREELLSQQVTHILNVSDAASLPETTLAPFAQVSDVPIADLTPIPVESALQCMEVIRRAFGDDDSKVFVHCIAGQNRSPTILWLFLIACGLKEEEAKERINRTSPDAAPGHRSLISEFLLSRVRAYGHEHPELASLLVDFS